MSRFPRRRIDIDGKAMSRIVILAVLKYVDCWSWRRLGIQLADCHDADVVAGAGGEGWSAESSRAGHRLAGEFSDCRHGSRGSGQVRAPYIGSPIAVRGHSMH